MALMNRNGAFKRIVGKRDKAYVQMEFNRNRVIVADAKLDKKHEKILRKQTLVARKRLYPLELAALSEAERSAALIERGMRAFDFKHSLRRRAVKQTYLNTVGKLGEAKAAENRDAANALLETRRAEYENTLKTRFKGADKTPAPKESAALYEQASKQEEARLSELTETLSRGKQSALNSLKAKLDAKNEKLRVRFDSADKQINAMSKVDKASFGDESVLNIQNLKMYFSGIKAVDDLSIDVRKGEIFGLIGPNGAGKTTVFNCITQFYKPNDGKIYYRDRFGSLVNLVDYNTHDIIKAGISRTFQNVELVYFLSVIENLLLGAHSIFSTGLAGQLLHSKTYKDEEAVCRVRAMELLDRLGIAAYAQSYPLGLPYGVLKKIELARTLMSNPKVIILDEPAAGLNEAETQELGEIILSIRDDFDCTVFLVEHDMNLVMGICDRVCAISFGKMLAIGTPVEIQNNPKVQEAYLGVG
ncbi:MAG: ATP-binding cassette domain-containing protein [Oscillospiraceae bacterium]|jgi:branched-chain amino acid transport system ATP-binding protein|nr:ATP-binding cassette domain-containing protein [Oscillospiraceae bacterium]